MRLPRVAASATLIVALALVVVPGSAGSRTPSEPQRLDPALLQPVLARLAPLGTTTATPELDAAYRSDGALDTGETIREPFVRFEAPVRAAVDSPEAQVRYVVKPVVRPAARSGGSGGAGGGGGGAVGGGGWRYDPEVSWYGPGFYGNRTACGLAYTRSIMGVAHRSLPCGTMVSFRHGGRVITVPVIDRGPYVAGRTWDLSGAACTALGHCYTGPIYWRFP